MKPIKLLAVLCLIYSGPALANWSFNLGYHNPPSATVGANFLYMGSKWGFEVGVGWVSVDSNNDDDDDKNSNANSNTTTDDDDDTTRVTVSGAMSLKYFFGSGGFRPYLQGGVGIGLAAEGGDDSGLGAGTGSGYGGLGIMIGGRSSPYVYGSFNLGASENSFFQVGIGFDI